MRKSGFLSSDVYAQPRIHHATRLRLPPVVSDTAILRCDPGGDALSFERRRNSCRELGFIVAVGDVYILVGGRSTDVVGRRDHVLDRLFSRNWQTDEAEAIEPHHECVGQALGLFVFLQQIEAVF